eukprot:scaffold34537_cov27-Tisochrysis_lutea.AAC.2
MTSSSSQTGRRVAAPPSLYGLEAARARLPGRGPGGLGRSVAAQFSAAACGGEAWRRTSTIETQTTG